MDDRMAFGLELRRIRERRGLSLEQVCEQTKVSAAHYAALESGDLTRWPSGIFRRAFVRSYATAVGLDPDQVLAEFARVFPDPADGPRAVARAEAALRAARLAAAEPSSEPAAEFSMFRLALDTPQPAHTLAWLATGGPRLASAAIDIAVAVVAAALVAAVFGRGWFWPTAALVAFAGHATCYALTGATPGAWALAHAPGTWSERLGLAGRRPRPQGEDATAPRGRRLRRSPGRPASHAHRMPH